MRALLQLLLDYPEMVIPLVILPVVIAVFIVVIEAKHRRYWRAAAAVLSQPTDDSEGFTTTLTSAPAITPRWGT